MKIKLKGKRVAVEKIKKQSKNQAHGGIIMPDSEEYLGHVRYVGEEADKSLVVGQKVFFSTNHQLVRMAGQELCVMEDTQIYAVVEEEA